MVADDDRVGRDEITALLRSAGYVVVVAEDGRDAVERVSQGGFDLVILDVVMPRLGGVEACRFIKTITADSFLPVVLMTARTDTGSRVEGLRIGADDYVCKPYDEEELLARVAAMLRIKHLFDQVTSQKAKLEKLSVHDEATGLYNYRFLHTRLAEEFKRAERYHEPFACLLVDIDQLRAINDLYGRPSGDQAIRKVAEGIRRSVREVDVVARYGGEEFLLVLPSTHFAGSVVVAERIWREVSGVAVDVVPADPSAVVARDEGRATSSAMWAGGARDVTISVGVALYPSRDVRSKDALLRAAEAALAQAKREGGNRICVYQQQGYIYSPQLASPVRDSQAPIRPTPPPDPALADKRSDAAPRSSRFPDVARRGR